MADLSRRSFLGASAAAAAGAAVIAVPIASAAASPKATAAPESLPLGGPGRATGPLMVWVSDARSGDFSVLVGAREVTHHDPDLVARPARPAGPNAGGPIDVIAPRSPGDLEGPGRRQHRCLRLRQP